MQTTIRPHKIKHILLLLAISASVFFTACKDETEIAKPQIISIVYGTGHDDPNGQTATQGGDMHMEAEIVAEGKIEYILVEIHPEDEEEGHHHEDEWEFDSTYVEGFYGLKNATFHKHIDIAATAEPGEYHVHFIVVDMEGNQVMYEGELEVLEAVSNIAVENFVVNGGEHDVSKAAGSFTISFDASVEHGTLASYSIEVHSEPESGNEEDEFKLIDDAFTENFAGLTMATVNKTITIDAAAPLGEYHVEVVIVDSEGNEKIVSGHIELED